MKNNGLHINRIFIIFIALVTIFWRNMDAKTIVFHKNGVLSNPVKDIFKLLGHPVDSLEKANEWAQKNLLRIGERWDHQVETDIRNKIQNKKEILIENLKGLGFIDEIKPKEKKYTYAFVMGALKMRVEQRLDYLADLIKDGCNFEILVLLGGERELRDIEKVDLPIEVKTEADMMVYLLKNHALLKDRNFIVVNAPMVKKDDGFIVRPNTDDTIVYFTKLAPKDGNCLVISNNPYIVRQTKVTERLLDQSLFPVDGAGSMISNCCNILMIIDEFARALYEEWKTFSCKNYI